MVDHNDQPLFRREGGRGLDQADPAWRPIPSQQGGLSLTAWRPARVAGDSGILPFRESGGADGAGDPGGLIVTGGAACSRRPAAAASSSAWPIRAIWDGSPARPPRKARWLASSPTMNSSL